MTTQGGGTDFADVAAICGSTGAYCLIGGLAVNCYVEPVYTMDADFVMVASFLRSLPERMEASGFTVERFPHSMNAQRGGSKLRIQFTTDSRYQDFPSRAAEQMVLDTRVMVASLDDVFQGKLWAWSDPARRVTKRKKDELDLLRLAEAYPYLQARLPRELQGLLG